MTIDSDFKKAEKLAIDATEKAIRGVALKIATTLVDRTRVDTGRLRGNVQVTLNSQAKEALNIEDKSGTKSKAAADLSLSRYTPADTIFIANVLPYARVMEDGNANIRGDKVWASTVSLFERELDARAKRHRI